MENWKNITVHSGKYADRYQVSDFGRVRTHPENKIRGGKPGRILFQGTDNRGYSQVYLYFDYKQTTFKVHRLVANAFLGEPEDGMTINHIDGDKSNNALSNLEYITNKENCWHAHRVIDGRAYVVVDGEKMCIPEAVDRFAHESVDANSVRRRIRRYGWSVEDALLTPKLPTGVGRNQCANQ